MSRLSDEKERSPIAVALELTSTGSDEIGSVRKIELSDGGIRLIVTLPKVIDGEQANLTAALLFQNLDRLPQQADIERIKINGLRFTEEGVVGVEGFLSLHASNIKHVSLKDMMRSGFAREEATAFASLAKVFRASTKLETLNLSDNTLCSSLWQNVSMHTSLRQLILDFVEMDDACLVEFQNNFCFGETLEELYVVLTNRMGERGLGAANSILGSCKMLSSLRWAEKEAPPEALMPWQGLADMALNDRIPSTLLHLVMDGGDILDSGANQTRLYSAIQKFPKLRTLKLRAIGLSDEHVRRIVDALTFSRPPLEILDFSKNHIKSAGALDLSRLSAIEPLQKTVSLVALERNRIDITGARNLLEAFGSPNNNPRLEIKLEGNVFQYSKLAFVLARRKAQTEMEREELQIELMQAQNSADSSHGSLPEARILRDEVVKLRDEKASLLRVLAIVSGSNEREDVAKTLDRITELEQAVYGITGSGHQRRDSQSSQAKSVSKLLAKAEAPTQSDSGRSNPGGRNKGRVYGGMTHVHSPTSRKKSSMKSNLSPGLASVSNILIRGISERWCSPPQKKTGGTTTISQSPSQNGMLRLGGSKHMESDTSHSRGSTASASPRGKDTSSGHFSVVLDHSTNSSSAYSCSSTRNF